MNLQTPGMEFASEMLIRGKRAGLRIDEIPIVYRARPEDSPSKLRSFRDGLRHLVFMLRHAPIALYWAVGAVVAFTGIDLLLVGGPIEQNQVAGAVLLGVAGLVVPSGHWLHLLDRTEREQAPLRWARSAAVAAMVATGVAAMTAGAILTDESRTLRLSPGAERWALVIVAIGLGLLGSAVWAAGIARVAIRRPSR
jgi:drug/metabolite transporter (DMT)-like permease